MKQYTGRERIQAAFNREYADRVPLHLDVGPHYAKEAGYSVEEYFGDTEKALDTHIKALEAFPSDTVTVPQNMQVSQNLAEAFRFKSGDRTVEPGCLKDKSALQDMECIPTEEATGFRSFLEMCRRVSSIFKNEATRSFVVGPFTAAAQLRGPEQLMLDTAQDPQFVHDLMRLITELCKARGLELGRTGLDIALFGDPTASSGLISPQTYRDLVKPYHQEIFSYLREQLGETVWLGLHICGFTDPIMEDMVALELDYIEMDGPSSLQKMMEVSQKKVVVRGNIGGELFIEGTKEQIEEAVKNCIDVAAKGSAYILSTGCQIPLNAPLENIKYFMEAGHNYGRYN